jgi:hypothetical protein
MPAQSANVMMDLPRAMAVTDFLDHEPWPHFRRRKSERDAAMIE